MPAGQRRFMFVSFVPGGAVCSEFNRLHAIVPICKSEF
ncbi:hypothetical protein T05_13497 [Trichinella murrelli]|uniref:Uncharacterized protein n=1 Tax=Trichinella murrelli TaxID=144512 RepID=A0A0V0SS19_9BILA|nr:hypothetical protein T05_13497 [Trichinella murrelli]